MPFPFPLWHSWAVIINKGSEEGIAIERYKMDSSGLAVNIAAASYEGSLFSWRAQCTSEDDSLACDVTMTSGFHCCAGSLKAIAVSESGKYMVCGGTDERIRIFNMRDNSTLGELTTHTGAITCLEFFGDTHLLSGSEDNTLCIWRVHDWLCVHILGGHKAAVCALSIHPSGMLALSVSKDKTLMVWNLVQGRSGFTRRLKSSVAPTSIAWQRPSGEHYLILTERHLEVFAAGDNTQVLSYTHTSRINQAVFMATVQSEENVNILGVIYENMVFELLSMDGVKLRSMDLSGLGGRLRDMSLCTVSNPIDSFPNPFNVVSIATSNGKIALLNVASILKCGDDASNDEVVESAMLTVYHIKVEPRLTCVVCWTDKTKQPSKSAKKRKKIEPSQTDEAVAEEEVITSTNKGSKKKILTSSQRKESKVRFAGELAAAPEVESKPAQNKSAKKNRKGKK